MSELDVDLSNLDIWNIQSRDNWLTFDGNLQGIQGIRAFRTHTSGSPIIAQTQAPFNAIFGLGGARVANSISKISDYPQHIFSPSGGPTTHDPDSQDEPREHINLSVLSEQTREALLAGNLIKTTHADKKALPVFQVKSEICNSNNALEFAEGSAIKLIENAIDTAAITAKQLKQKLQIPVILLNFGFEHIDESAVSYRDGIIAVMKRLERKLAEHDLPPPVFLATFDCGTQTTTTSSAIKGQWELSWNCADHKFHFALPSYALHHEYLGWLSKDGLEVESDYFTLALQEVLSNKDWRCPIPYLAHRVEDHIKVLWQSSGPIIIDTDDPFGAGPLAGFAVSGIENDATLHKVELDPNDSQALILQFQKKPEGLNIQVKYAAEAAPRENDNFPANRGAIREDWVGKSNDRSIYRWGLPTILPLSLEPME